MPGLKTWNGSAFVDYQPRIWNGSAFVAPSACWIWDGTKYVKVWPTFARQRMVKSGTYTPPQSSTTQVTGWASDTTYPAVVQSNALKIVGSGAITLTVLVDTTSSGSGPSWRVMRNSTQVNQFTSSAGQTYTKTYNLTVADGDLISLTAIASGFGLYCGIEPPSYIDAAPA